MKNNMKRAIKAIRYIVETREITEKKEDAVRYITEMGVKEEDARIAVNIAYMTDESRIIKKYGG